MAHPLRLFGLTTTSYQLRRELRRMADAAQVPYVSPQGFRRFAINQWGAVDGYAAAILQGQALGSLSHYLDGARILCRCAPKVVVPDAWLTESERANRIANEYRLLHAYRLANPETQSLILQVVERVN